MSTDPTPTPLATEPPALASAVPEPAMPPGKPLWLRPGVIVGALACVLLGGQWFAMQQRINGLEAELAKRLSQGDETVREARTLGKQSREEIQDLIARVGVMDAKLNDAQGQQEALESLYQDFARGRDERLLAEIEQAVAIAAQQLQLAGNVEAALIALQGADARLSRSNAQFSNVHRLLVRDIERLKALPQADVSGMAVRLENVAAQVDALPLAYTQRPPKSAPRPDAPAAAKPAVTESAWWSGLANDLWGDMRQLVRIERMDQTAPALLAPSQSLFLRENLRLRLVNARLSLLQRDGRSFRTDLELAIKWLDLYFDTRNPAVQTSRATLQRLAETNLNLELPKLDETLAALRNVKPPREKK